MNKHKILLTLIWLGLSFSFSQTSVLAKDEWLRVESKNFHLIGNASEKDIRRVATKLEQFRETFRLLFNKANFISPIPTNVVVFKNGSSYKPFKPKRADGKIDEWIAGYFQSGSDVNYITLSTEGETSETFGTIFHEYVHFLVNINYGKSDIPPWFNEGIAEYYQTFEIEEDTKAKLGLPQDNHLRLLQQSKFIPLQTLFNINNYSLKENGNHSRSIFYAESWALIHYLIQGSKGAKNEGLNKFLSAILNDVPMEKAFQDAFQMTFAEMEKELTKYISQGTYRYQYITFKQKLVFDDQMKVSPLSEADTNAYLGDLLFHTHRLEDAEPFLQKTLAVEPNSSLANTTLGILKVRQRKFDEAKKYLDKAIANDHKNHMAYYNYAYLLSREGMDEFGFVSTFDREKAAQMRDALNKAIAINPSFIESYELLGFINLVNNEQLDETVQVLKKALAQQPGNQEIILRIAEILSRQEKFAEALQIADKVAKTADEESIKSRAENLKNRIQTMQSINAQNEAARKQYEEAMKNNGQTSARPPLMRRQSTSDNSPTPEEIAKANEAQRQLNLNQSLKKTGESQKQIVGHLQKISCANNNITYLVKTESEIVSFNSKDFQSLALMAYESDAEKAQIACNANLSKHKAVFTYQPNKAPKLNSLGELVRIDFVPEDFRLLSQSEIETAQAIVDKVENAPTEPPPVTGNGQTIVGNPNSQDFEEMRRNAMMKAMKEALRKPLEGEKQDLGTIEKIECDKNGQFFVFKTSTTLLKLKAPQNIQIRAFIPDAGGQQFGCGMKAFDIPAVFTYKADDNPKAKINGELISIDFVPKSFKLEN